MIRDSVNHFCIHDDGIKRDQVRNKKPDVLSFAEDVEDRLLPKRNASETKLDCQGIFVRLLKQPVTKRVKNLDGTADNLKNFFFG